MEYIVMDIGGTFIKHAVMDESFVETQSASVPTEKDPERFLAQLVDVIKGHGEGYGGVAVSMAGFIDPVTGENTDYGCSERFVKYNLRQKLALLTGYRVSVENDSNCAALAELCFGAAKGCKTVAVMTVGTGIGGAVIADGKLFRGKSFKAGEYGFALTSYTLEDGKIVPHYAKATSALVRRCSEALGREVDGIYIFDNIDKNPEIKRIYSEWLADIAVCIGNVCVALDPEKFLVGGAVSTQKRFMCDLRAAVYGAFEHLEDYTAIEPCSMGNNAGKVGALKIFFDNYGK